ncbi:CDP-glycerol glycerophosphotransferase family protein [Lactococcus lactis]|uniref:CDP-glycerol glycerophosphotransferase family protein n=1 Tax=Lactococcus lactis TaxID=1358 RepID=UPI003D0FC6B1
MINLTLKSRYSDKTYVSKRINLLKLVHSFVSEVEIKEREIFDVFSSNKPYVINRFSHFCLILFPFLFLKKSGDFIIFPYTRGKRKLSISILPWNGKSEKYYVWEYFAFLVGKFQNLVGFKPILVFEKKSNFAADSGILVFQYLRKNYPGLPVYYIIKKKSRDFYKLQKDNHAIIFGSFKHLCYLCSAGLFVSTEGKGHSYFWGERNGLVARSVKLKKFIFLQHGIIGFKRIDNIFNANNIYSPDIFVSSSKIEKNIINENLGYGNSEKKEVVITGLPRFDSINFSQKRIYITFFYTWRSWVERKTLKEQLESDYIYHLREVAKKAEKYKEIKIIIHPKLAQLMQKEVEKNPDVFIDTSKISIKEILDETKLLITDYSSVAWESYYRNVPVIFDMFDQKQYEQEIGSYMNLDILPFGEKRNVLNEWEKVINHPLLLTKEEKEMQELYFQFRDDKNTQRCAEHVLKYYKEVIKNE